MQVPFTFEDNKPVCMLDMTSQPQLDMSFEHEGKHYKVIEVIESCDKDKIVTGYECMVKMISKKRFEQD
jgi:hypothetical protein